MNHFRRLRWKLKWFLGRFRRVRYDLDRCGFPRRCSICGSKRAYRADLGRCRLSLCGRCFDIADRAVSGIRLPGDGTIVFMAPEGSQR